MAWKPRRDVSEHWLLIESEGGREREGGAGKRWRLRGEDGREDNIQNTPEGRLRSVDDRGEQGGEKFWITYTHLHFYCTIVLWDSQQRVSRISWFHLSFTSLVLQCVKCMLGDDFCMLQLSFIMWAFKSDLLVVRDAGMMIALQLFQTDPKLFYEPQFSKHEHNIHYKNITMHGTKPLWLKWLKWLQLMVEYFPSVCMLWTHAHMHL